MRAKPRSEATFIAALGLLLAATVGPTGCAMRDATVGRQYRLASLGERRELRLTPDVVVYDSDDPTTADFYLSDLPRAALEPGAPLAGVSGNLVHVHMFVRPRAGRTPIDATAMTATVTHVVVAGGEVGVYAGGGFFRPLGESGGGRYGAAVEAGTLRLLRRTGGFRDLLGASRLDAAFHARRDARMAERLSRRLEELMRRGEAVGEG